MSTPTVKSRSFWKATLIKEHWIEVDGIKDGSFKTIFSGLGYYL